MGSYWSYEDTSNIEVVEAIKKEEHCEKLLKIKIDGFDIVEELKNNPNFNERKNRSKSRDT